MGTFFPKRMIVMSSTLCTAKTLITFHNTPLTHRYDPDILVGYEVQMHSWGYLLQRALTLGVDLCQQLSRVPGKVSSVSICKLFSAL